MLSSFYNTISFHEFETSTTQMDAKNIHMTPSTDKITFTASIIPMSPSRSMRINNKLSLNLPIFLPSGRFHLVWSIILFFILTYSIIQTPYTISFVGLPSEHDAAYIISLFIDGLLFFDIAINFRTAYIDKYDRLRVIYTPTLIANHYISTWFIVDFIAAFPFSFIVLLSDNTNSTKYLLLFRLLRLIKLIRIIRILKMFKLFQQQIFTYESRCALKLIKMVGFILLTAHFCACFWYFVGVYTYQEKMDSWIDIIVEKEGEPLNDIPNFKLYSCSMYWTISTLFTTGYGDITAQNEYEQWTVIGIILIGCGFFAYFIGVLTSLLNEDRVRGYKTQKIEESLLFCSHYNLPKELSLAIVNHIGYYQKYNYVFDDKEIMDALPSYLQKSVQTHLAKNMLSGLDIFESLSPSIIGQIALKLKSKSINMGHLLYKAGDIGKELYIQRTGQSKLFYNDSAYYKILKRGDVCGENIIINRKRLHSVQCETWSEFYTLNIRDIIDILKNSLDPLTAQKEWDKIKQTVRGTKDTNTSRHTPIAMEKFPKLITNLKGFDTEHNNNDNNIKKARSIHDIFNMGIDESTVRNENILKDFNKEASHLVIEIPRGHHVDDENDDNKSDSTDDRSDDSEDSGGFGERFGLYKIRKYKKKTSYDQERYIPSKLNIMDVLESDLNVDSNKNYDDQSEVIVF